MADVTLAQGTGRVGDEKNVYVLLSTPVGGLITMHSIQPRPSWGSTRPRTICSTIRTCCSKGWNPALQIQFAPIDVFTEEGDTVGAMVVDPTNPNGRVHRWRETGQRGHFAALNDPCETGNMRDADYDGNLHGGGPTFEYDGNHYNDGDDIDKGLVGWDPVNVAYIQYPGTNPAILYDHEGVYWYDLEQSHIGDFFPRANPTSPPRWNEWRWIPQGRILFGTAGGLYRGLPLGFDYDYTRAAGECWPTFFRRPNTKSTGHADYGHERQSANLRPQRRGNRSNRSGPILQLGL